MFSIPFLLFNYINVIETDSRIESRSERFTVAVHDLGYFTGRLISSVYKMRRLDPTMEDVRPADYRREEILFQT